MNEERNINIEEQEEIVLQKEEMNITEEEIDSEVWVPMMARSAVIGVQTVQAAGTCGTCSTTVNVTGGSVSPGLLSIEKGKKGELDVTVKPPNAADKSVRYSYDDSIISINSSGCVTAKNVGTSTVSVYSNDGNVRLGNSTVTVYVNEVTSGTVKPGMLELEVGNTGSLNVTIQPLDATDKSVRFTYDSNIISINSCGCVTAKKAGTSTVAVYSNDNGTYLGNSTVIVYPKEVFAKSVELSVTSKEVKEGQSFRIDACILPENTTNKDVVWTSSCTDTATVDRNTGLVKAIKKGTATITATVNDGSKTKNTCEVTVRPILVNYMDISKTTLS